MHVQVKEMYGDSESQNWYYFNVDKMGCIDHIIKVK
jgi:hypothetical protein